MTDNQKQQKYEQSVGQANYSNIIMKYQAVIKDYAVNIYSLTFKYISVKYIKNTMEEYYTLYFL